MVNFESVFSDAQQLSTDDRLRLIDELCNTVPEASQLPFDDEWKEEIERRVESINSSQATTTEWATIRDAALRSLSDKK